MPLLNVHANILHIYLAIRISGPGQVDLDNITYRVGKGPGCAGWYRYSWPRFTLFKITRVVVILIKGKALCLITGMRLIMRLLRRLIKVRLRSWSYVIRSRDDRRFIWRRLWFWLRGIILHPFGVIPVNNRL